MRLEKPVQTIRDVHLDSSPMNPLPLTDRQWVILPRSLSGAVMTRPTSIPSHLEVEIAMIQQKLMQIKEHKTGTSRRNASFSGSIW